MVSDGTLTGEEAAPRSYDERGALHALQTFITAHQEEALRVAYLLTGDGQRAGELAEAAFRAQLGAIAHSDAEHEPREDLLHSLGRFFLHAPPVASATLPEEPARYRVQDERARMWVALDLCDSPQRLALVLRDFSRLDEETVVGLLHLTPRELPEQLEPARRRLLDAVGARPEQTPRTLLLTLALGAPRLDLWSRLEATALRHLERERRRRRLLTWAVLAGVAVLLTAGALWLGAGRPGSDDEAQAAVATAVPRASSPPAPTFTARPIPTPLAGLPQRPVAHIPDLQLFGYLEDDGGERPSSTALIYAPPSGDHKALENLTQGVRLSPGGRWLAFTTFGDQFQGGVPTLGVIEASSQRQLWGREIPHLDGRPVFAQERLFIVTFERTGEGAPELVALAPQDGRELGRWHLPSGGYTSDWGQVGALRLFPAIDESRLYVIYEQTEERSDSGQRIILTYRLPGLTLEHAAAQEIRLERGFLRPVIDLATARPTPDGRGIYSMSYEPSAPGLRFLDFETAAFLSVELPFETPGPNTIPDLRAVLAHDGWELYVLSGNGDVAIFDLHARRVTRVFQLDPGGYELSSSTAAQWFYWLDNGLLAPDGTRLYLVNIWTPQAGPTDREAVSVIWSIDLTRWRVSERREYPGEIQALSLSADGSRLYAAVAELTGRNRRGYTYDNQLLEIDAATGASRAVNAELGLPEDPLAVWTNSLQQVYRQQYGVTPVTAGVAPGTTEAHTSLPRLGLSVSARAAPAGSALEIEARLLDPGSGGSLDLGVPGVRFDPAATVSIVLSRPDAAEVILVPYPVDAVTHRATVRLEQPGRWRATVVVTYPDGTRWSRSWPDVVQISPALQAIDGGRYIFDLAVEPGEPLAGIETLFRATLVDAVTGAPLPERVQLNAGMPELIEVALHKVDGAFTSVTLLPVGHGVYAAGAVIQWPGRWQASMSFRVLGQPAVTLSAGEVVVS